MATGTSNTVEGRLVSVCKTLRAQLARLKALLKRDQRFLAEAKSSLKELEGRPVPDKVAIKALKQRIKDLTERIAQQELDVIDLQEVITENCSLG